MDRIETGTQLPSLTKGPVTRQMLVEWCAAENDYFNLHYDERVAASMNLPGTPVQGTFKYALMSQMVERWLGSRGRLRKISASYRGLDLEGETLTACGMVTDTEDSEGTTLIHIDVWVENTKGERFTSGQATAVLPC